jgi:hypothetical protein
MAIAAPRQKSPVASDVEGALMRAPRRPYQLHHITYQTPPRKGKFRRTF